MFDMPTGPKRHDSPVDIFAVLCGICVAHSTAVAARLPSDGEDRKLHREHLNRMNRTETLLMLGYIHMSGGEEGVMQSFIIGTLARSDPDNRPKIAQSVMRRVRSLEYFGLVERRELAANAVQLRVTAAGHAFIDDLNAHMNGANTGRSPK